MNHKKIYHTLLVTLLVLLILQPFRLHTFRGYVSPSNEFEEEVENQKWPEWLKEKAKYYFNKVLDEFEKDRFTQVIKRLDEEAGGSLEKLDLMGSFVDWLQAREQYKNSPTQANDKKYMEKALEFWSGLFDGAKYVAIGIEALGDLFERVQKEFQKPLTSEQLQALTDWVSKQWGKIAAQDMENMDNVAYWNKKDTNEIAGWILSPQRQTSEAKNVLNLLDSNRLQEVVRLIAANQGTTADYVMSSYGIQWQQGQMVVVTHSPVYVKVIGPRGESAGFEANGTRIEEMPYSMVSYFDDPFEPKVVGIPRLEEGRYLIRLTGLDDGPYTLLLIAFDTDHNLVSKQLIMGYIRSGEVQESNLTVKKSGDTIEISKIIFSSNKKHLLIITSRDMVSAAQDLALYRNATGTPSHVLATDEIERNYQGRDLPEKIRNAIIYYYKNRGVSSVVLAGDTNKVPTRLIYNPSPYFGSAKDNQTTACDDYFGGLEGDWDQDHDNKFGETKINNANSTDEADFTPEVYVGRLPASTLEELQIIVQKIKQYRRIEKEKYDRMLCLIGGKKPEDPYGKDYYSFLLNSSHVDVPTTLLSEVDGNLTYLNAQNYFEEGYGYVTSISHGSITSLALREQRPFFDVRDAKYSRNAPVYSFWFIIACEAGYLDDLERRCIPEELMAARDGGAAGVVAASRLTWGDFYPYYTGGGGLSELAWRFWEYIFRYNATVGEAFCNVKRDYVTSNLSNMSKESQRRDILGTILFADPTLNIRLPSPLSKTEMELILRPSSIKIDGSINIVARLTCNNASLVNEKVNFFLEQTPIGTVTTDSSGNAMKNLTVNLGAGTYKIRTSYGGSSFYSPCETTGSLVVRPLNTTLGLEAPSTTAGQLLTLKATLKDEKGNQMPNFPVDFHIYEQNTWNRIGSSPTDSNGIASIRYTPSAAGTYQVKATFDGTNNYAKSNAATSLNIAIDYTPYLGIAAIATVLGIMPYLLWRRNIKPRSRSK